MNFLYGCARIGYPRTRKQVLTIVQEHLIKKGSSKVVTNGWWQRFSKRHENLSLRTAAPLSLPRAKAMDRDTIDHYFEVLESTMRENGIITKPGQIFNCDETGIPLAPKPPKVIAKRGEKNPSYITGDTKAQISVLACVNAAGRWIPPMVIFDRKKLSPAFTSGEVANTYYGLSSKGWMDAGLFSSWFTEHFLRYCGSESCQDLMLRIFPSKKRTVANRIANEVVVDLYCLCRQPEMSKAMACCDICEEWYHKGCVPFPDEVLMDTDDLVDFSCCQCKCNV